MRTLPAGRSQDEAQATTFPVRTYTISVIEAVRPTLDNVLNTNNVEIPEGKTTVSNTLKLKGTASKGQDVQILDGTGSGSDIRGTATADATTGIWELTVTVPLGDRRLYAKALYPVDPLYSLPRTLEVVAVITPTLTNVLDDKGVEVAQGKTTISTSLKLTGTASKGQDVEIYDGNGASAESKGIATANNVSGIWEHPITVALGPRRLYARSLYHSGSIYSAVRNLVVTADTTPSIDSVKGSLNGVEIPEGGSTVERAVTISGKAAKGQTVEILDGATSKGKATGDISSGIWTLLDTVLTVASYKLTAKALYGAGTESRVWNLNIIDTVNDLTSFDGGDWNNWRAMYHGSIASEGGNYFFRQIGRYTQYNGIAKNYSLIVGSEYEVSFMYRASETRPTHGIAMEVDYGKQYWIHSVMIREEQTKRWVSESFKFTATHESGGDLIIGFSGNVIDNALYDLDNIRIREAE
jgi:hypothetical protein